MGKNRHYIVLINGNRIEVPAPKAWEYIDIQKTKSMKLKDETLDLINEYGITRVRAIRKYLDTRNLLHIEQALDSWHDKSYKIRSNMCVRHYSGICTKKMYDDLGNYFSYKYQVVINHD